MLALIPMAALFAAPSPPTSLAGLTYQLYFQDNLHFTMTAPPGWSGDTQPLPDWPREFVLVPSGTTRATADAVLYGEVFTVPPGRSSGDVEGDLVDGHFRGQLGLAAAAARPLPVDDGRMATVRRFSGRGACYDVAFVGEPRLLVILVMYGRACGALDGRAAAFATFVGSYAKRPVANGGSLGPWMALAVLAFFVFFGALWIFISFTVSLLGGWWELSRLYRAQPPFTPPLWKWQSAHFRFPLGRYRHALKVGADERGLSLAVFVFFRPGHPPLFIPWSEITITRQTRLFARYLEFRFSRSSVPVDLPAGLEDGLRHAAGPGWPGVGETPARGVA